MNRMIVEEGEWQGSHFKRNGFIPSLEGKVVYWIVLFDNILEEKVFESGHPVH